MSADGSDVRWVTLRGGTVIMGYQSEFKIQWAATKVHLFSAAAAVPLATPEGLASFTADVIQYAKNTKGQLRGLQTGVAVIATLVADTATPEARVAAVRRPHKEFAAMNFPAIVDLATESVYTYTGPIVLGSFYAGWIRKRLATAFPPPR
jgi:hypothetical protein